MDNVSDGLGICCRSGTIRKNRASLARRTGDVGRNKHIPAAPYRVRDSGKFVCYSVGNIGAGRSSAVRS